MTTHQHPMGHPTPTPQPHPDHQHHGMTTHEQKHSTAHPAGHTDHANHTDHSGHELMFRKRFWVSLILTIPVLIFTPMIQMWVGFSAPEFTGSELIAPIFALVIFFYGGVPFIQMALPEWRTRQPGMMTLISMAISVAFVYSVAALFFDPESGFFWEMATLIDVMLLGHWFEMRSVRQASGALNELAKLMPDTAERIVHEQQTETVQISELRKGDVVLVRPGASVPVDGLIVDGTSDINEALITGESMPVKKTVGAKVIGGTLNGDGSLRVEVTALGDETALAGIMRLVEQAQQSKSRTQLLADKAAAWLFYIALGAAALTAIGWLIALGFDIEVLKRVVTVLVIACPHALGLAIPLVVAISTSLAARNGILVRDRKALENARLINMVVFDKTGTLTQGEQGVVNMVSITGWDMNQALGIAATLEADSEHIMAKSIVKAAQAKNAPRATITEFSAIKGRGVQGVVEGKPVYVGGPRLLEQLTLQPTETLADFTQQAGERGQSVIYLVVAGEMVAAFALADVIRPESKLAVERLHAMGIEVAMLTGDSQAVAKAVAQQLGIDRYFAEVLPEHKDQKIAELQSQGKRVAMVGDGVNDAPALTRADLGIAIGSGTDVAIESAGIILVRNNPLDVLNIISLSRASYSKMIQNLLWATGYNVFAIPLAAGVLAPIGILLSPAVGAVAMSLSTIVVAFNAQLLRRWSAVR